MLLALVRDPAGGATRVLQRLGVTAADVSGSRCLADAWAPPIDPDALAALGIDLGAVRERRELGVSLETALA